MKNQIKFIIASLKSLSLLTKYPQFSSTILFDFLEIISFTIKTALLISFELKTNR